MAGSLHGSGQRRRPDPGDPPLEPVEAWRQEIFDGVEPGERFPPRQRNETALDGEFGDGGKNPVVLDYTIDGARCARGVGPSENR